MIIYLGYLQGIRGHTLGHFAAGHNTPVHPPQQRQWASHKRRQATEGAASSYRDGKCSEDHTGERGARHTLVLLPDPGSM